MDLDFVRIECDVTTPRLTELTEFFYEALRSFEGHFKAASCLSAGCSACTRCRYCDGCPYMAVFSQKLSSDPEIVRIHQKPPLPFSLYVSKLDCDTSSSAITIGLVIIGSAVNYVTCFHTALLQLIETAVSTAGNSVEYLHDIYTLDYQGGRHKSSPDMPFPESVHLLSGKHILDNSVHSDTVRIRIISPLRLLCNGSIIQRFDFAAFFRSQLRRCSSLCAYYGSGTLELDFVQLSELVRHITVFDDTIRYCQPEWSERRNRAGLIGMAECTGLLEPMVPLLLLGSFFNAGKGASYGFGLHQIEVV